MAAIAAERIANEIADIISGHSPGAELGGNKSGPGNCSRSPDAVRTRRGWAGPRRIAGSSGFLASRGDVAPGGQ